MFRSLWIAFLSSISKVDELVAVKPVTFLILSAILASKACPNLVNASIWSRVNFLAFSLIFCEAVS